MNWLKRLFGRKVAAEPKVTPVAARPETPAVALAPPEDAVAVAVVPDVALLLQQAEERKAFERAFLMEGLSVEAQSLPDLIAWRERGSPKLVVVDDPVYFRQLLDQPIDVILVTDKDVESGPVGDHAYIAHRPLDLANPLGK